VYVKAAQLASQLSDVPRAYRDACATLQDRAGWRPYHEVASTLRAHSLLGALAHIEEQPAAAASLAQVRGQCTHRSAWACRRACTVRRRQQGWREPSRRHAAAYAHDVRDARKREALARTRRLAELPRRFPLGMPHKASLSSSLVPDTDATKASGV
jgi:hypothetical protein